MDQNNEPNNSSPSSREELRKMISELKEIAKDTQKPRKPGRISQVDPNRLDRGTYYNEKEARNLIPILDEIAQDKQEREFRYDDYPYWTPNTIWAKVNQAIKYIVDNLDTEDCKYGGIRNCLKISRGETGVMIKFIDSPVYQERGWIVHKVNEPGRTIGDYKLKVINFMEQSSEGDELDMKDNLNLTDEEVQYMKTLFSDSPIFMAYVSSNRIKIVHTKESNNEP